MKVYELMSQLAVCPSGADVSCSATLSVPELKEYESLGEDEYGDNLYSFNKDLNSVENEGETVYLSF